MDEVTVTDADREALDKMFMASARAYGRGERDDEPFLQILARHREQSIAPYREALEEARAYVANNHDKGCELDPDFSKIWCGSGRWTKICTCGTAELLTRIDTALQKGAK